MTTSTAPHKQRSTREDLCRTAAYRAVMHAGIHARDIDAVVIGTIDGTEPTAIAGRSLARSLGLRTEVPVVVINTGGATGASLPHVASHLVRGRTYRTVLCVGPPTFDGVVDFQKTLNTISQAVGSPLDVGPVHVGAVMAATYQQQFDVPEEAFAAVAVAARANAVSNPFAHLRTETTTTEVLSSPIVSSPLRLGMVCPISSTACAIVVQNPEAAAASPNPRIAITGIASTADTGHLQGRANLGQLDALAMLARRVFRTAGVTDPLSDLDLAELFSPYACFELMQYEALGLCPPGQGATLMQSGATRADGQLAVNLSGGPLCTNAGVASELAPFGYVTLQLMGQAAGVVRPQARRGVAHSMGSSWFACNSLAVLERVSEEEP